MRSPNSTAGVPSDFVKRQHNKYAASLTVQMGTGLYRKGMRDSPDLATLTRFARKIGVAFQMVDDSRPYLLGNPQHEKDVLADIASRTVTFPLVVARARTRRAYPARPRASI